MKHINTLFISVICGILVASCGHKSGGLKDFTTVKFYDYTEKPFSDKLDDFFSDKRYVVLHADEQNLMIGEITKLIVHDNKIFVADSRIRSLVVHDMNGRAIAKVGNRGRGPGEYLNLTDFDIDKQGRIHLIDGNADKLLIYGADYKFEEALDPPFEVDVIKCLPDGGYLFGLSSWDNSRYGGTRIIKTTQNLEVKNEIGEYDTDLTDNNVIISNYHFIETPDGIFYQKSPDENVYLLNNDGNVEKTWFIDLGRYSIPASDRGNLGYLMESGNIASYKALMNFAVPWGKYIFGGMYDRGDFKSYVYDTESMINYTETQSGPGNYGTISDGWLIAFMPYAGFENIPNDLPENMRLQVAEGHFLICLYKLK